MAEQPGALLLPVTVLERLALVVGLLAGDQRDLDLGATARVEIDLQRHDGAAFALEGADQLVDLLAMQQKLPWPLRLMEVRGRKSGTVGCSPPPSRVARASFGVTRALPVARTTRAC